VCIPFKKKAVRGVEDTTSVIGKEEGQKKKKPRKHNGPNGEQLPRVIQRGGQGPVYKFRSKKKKKKGGGLGGNPKKGRKLIGKRELLGHSSVRTEIKARSWGNEIRWYMKKLWSKTWNEKKIPSKNPRLQGLKKGKGDGKKKKM